jgi:hypothetical protein
MMDTATGQDLETTISQISDFICASVDPRTGSVEECRHDEALLSEVSGSWIDDWINRLVAASLLSPNSIRVVTPSRLAGSANQLEVEVTRDDLEHGATIPRLADGSVLAKGLAEGQTVMLGYTQITDPVMREICWRSGQRLGHPVGASLFISPPGAEGFIAHFDAADNVVVQLYGNKHWSFFAQRAPRTAAVAPWRSVGRYIDPHLTANPTFAEGCTLTRGDAIAFPSGTIHDVKGADKPSVHVTFELLPVIEYDFDRERLEVRAHLAGQAKRVDLDYDDGTRRPFPARDAGYRDEDLPLERLDAIAWHKLMRRVYKVLPDTPQNLTEVLEVLGAGPDAALYRLRTNVFVRIENQSDRVVIHLQNDILALPPLVAGVILSKEQFDVEDLSERGQISAAQARTLISRLVILGLLQKG